MSEPTQSQPETATAPPPKAKGITLTPKAAGRLKQMMEQKGKPDAGLRIVVKGGGCSGLTYSMDWAEGPKEKDKIFEQDGVRVFVDTKSFLYVAGTEIDFVESFMSSMFKLNNPNQKAACGCGESFSV